MKTFPDFTWEWIIKSFENMIDALQIPREWSPEAPPETTNPHIQIAQAMLDIIPQLRAHPQLEQLVPMKSIVWLRWFPADNCSVFLEYLDGNYCVSVYSRDEHTDVEIRESKKVGFGEVANEVYSYIERFRQD